MENFPSGILRSILNVSWFVRNDDARETIKIPTLDEEITNYANAYLNGVKNHTNPSAKNCYSTYPEDLAESIRLMYALFIQNKLFINIQNTDPF